MNLLPSRPEMERAFMSGDATYDGIFLTGVRTTGIFCRPSCPAKKPLLENIEFFGNSHDAVFAGYRPCLRCRPMDNDFPDWIRPLLDRIEKAPEEKLGAAEIRGLGIDPTRARRYFLKHHGMTFNAYCRGRRLGEAFTRIREGASLDDAAYDHGYESISGFRDAFRKTFGQAPGRIRGEEYIATSWIETPLGPMIAGAGRDGICFLEFTDRRGLEAQLGTLRRRFGKALVPGENGHTKQLSDELGLYFKGELKRFTPPLFYPGTKFQEEVWSRLLEIPYGETRSYAEMAAAVGSPNAVRAVGTANGANRIAIVIPCHRVVNKNGEMGGYGGGLWRKKFLLNLEQQNRMGDRR